MGNRVTRHRPPGQPPINNVKAFSRSATRNTSITAQLIGSAVPGIEDFFKDADQPGFDPLQSVDIAPMRHPKERRRQVPYSECAVKGIDSGVLAFLGCLPDDEAHADNEQVPE
jgi:hypothetical protein